MDDEKLEAMRETLELLMRMHMDNEKRFQEHQERFEETEAQIRALTSQVADLGAACGKLYDATGRLLDIATAHERRLDKLEVVQEWLAEKERQREKRGE